MRAHEILPKITLAKIEKTGQVVQLVKHADHVGFSDERGWFLINTNPGADTGPSDTVKWIPDSTRFEWVKKFRDYKIVTEINRWSADMWSGGKKDIPVNVGDQNLNKIKPLPGGSRFGYYTVKGTYGGIVIYVVDPKKPMAQREHKNDIIVGKLLLDRTDVVPGLTNTYIVQTITVDEDYRNLGIAKSMYGIALAILKFNLVAGRSQTPGGRKMWQILNSIPGVETFGIVNVNYVGTKTGRAIMRQGGRMLSSARSGDYKVYAFPVTSGIDELTSAIKEIQLYGGKWYDRHGALLVARWHGQTYNESITEFSNLDEAYIDTLKRGDIEIPVNSHALDRVIQRQILPTDVDRILRKLDTVRDQLDQVAGNQKFWLYDAKLDVALGFQKSDTVNTKYYLNTVVGDRPHDSHVLVINV